MLVFQLNLKSVELEVPGQHLHRVWIPQARPVPSLQSAGKLSIGPGPQAQPLFSSRVLDLCQRVAVTGAAAAAAAVDLAKHLDSLAAEETGWVAGLPGILGLGVDTSPVVVDRIAHLDIQGTRDRLTHQVHQDLQDLLEIPVQTLGLALVETVDIVRIGEGHEAVAVAVAVAAAAAAAAVVVVAAAAAAAAFVEDERTRTTGKLS